MHTTLLIIATILATFEASAGSPPSFPRFPHLGWLSLAVFFLAMTLGFPATAIRW